MIGLTPPLRFPTFTNAIEIVNNTTSAPLAANYTIVQKYLPKVINAAGRYVRLGVVGPATGTCTLSDTYIGLSAIIGAVWSFTTTPTAITWDGGSASKVLSPNVIYYSDLISFTIDDNVAVSLAYNVASGSSVRFKPSLSADYIGYAKSGVSEAGTASKGASYTPVPNVNYIINVLQVDI